MKQIHLSCVLSLILSISCTLGDHSSKSKAVTSENTSTFSESMEVDESELSNVGNHKEQLEDLKRKVRGSMNPELKKKNTYQEISLFLDTDTLDDKNVNFVLDNQDSKITHLKKKLTGLKSKNGVKPLNLSKLNLYEASKEGKGGEGDVEQEVLNTTRSLFKEVMKKKIYEQVTKNKFTKKFFNEESPLLLGNEKMRPRSPSLVQEDSKEETSEDDEELFKESAKLLNKRNLTDEEEVELQTSFRRMWDRELEKKFDSIIAKKQLAYRTIIEQPHFASALNTLVFGKYFYRKQHINSFLEDVLGRQFYCTLELTQRDNQYFHVVKTDSQEHLLRAKSLPRGAVEPSVDAENAPSKDEIDNPIRLKGKLREKSKFYHEREDEQKKRFGLNFEKVAKFNRDFNGLCELIDNLNFFFGQTITASGLDKTHSLLDPEGLVLDTGHRLECYLLRNYKRFQELKNSVEKYIYDLEEALLAVDCDVRDLMYFYLLLPRFRVIYSQVKRRRNPHDHVVMYYRDKVTQLTFKWQQSNKAFFKYYSFFLFWFSFLEGLFELPFSLSQDRHFKYTMFERTIESWMDVTTLSLKFRTDSDLLLAQYEETFEELRDLFQGLEEYIAIKIPFDIKDIRGAAGLLVSGVLALMALLWT